MKIVTRVLIYGVFSKSAEIRRKVTSGFIQITDLSFEQSLLSDLTPGRQAKWKQIGKIYSILQIIKKNIYPASETTLKIKFGPTCRRAL